MDEELETALIKWAHKYNGYDRLARNPEHLWELVRPFSEAFNESGDIPEWVGVDLLRGCAFYLVREDRHVGGGTLGREFEAVVDAIDRHPKVRAAERPPRQRR